MKQAILKYFLDIRFWIVLFFVIRMIGITNPPLEVSHNWRQTTVTMVTRNFLEVDNNILYPRIDFAGEKTGITGMEFPVYNYSIYLVSEIFGYQHWYGRLINLFVSSIGLYFFFLLARKYFSERTAFYATLVLLFSIWFIFSRKIMPDTFSMSFMLAGMYYGTNYLDRKGRSIELILYVILITTGILSKLPSGYLLVLFAPFLFTQSIPSGRKMIFVFASCIAIAPVVWWYFIWVPFLVKEYEFWHFFMGKPFIQGTREIYDNLQLTLSRFYETALKISGFLLFIIGIVKAIIDKKSKLLLVLTLSFAAFLVVIFKAGFTFSHHSYYIVPFVPVMALLAGYAIDTIKLNWLRFLTVIIIACESFAGNYQDFIIPERLSVIQNLESELDKFSERDELILINSEHVPTPVYFTHRKGWINTNTFIADPKNIDSLSKLGLKHIIILNNVFGQHQDLPYMISTNSVGYTIYTIK